MYVSRKWSVSVCFHASVASCGLQRLFIVVPNKRRCRSIPNQALEVLPGLPGELPWLSENHLSLQVIPQKVEKVVLWSIHKYSDEELTAPPLRAFNGSLEAGSSAAQLWV